MLCQAKNIAKAWQLISDKASHIITRYEEIKAEKGSDDPLAIQYALRAWINSMKKNKEYDLSGVTHYNHVDEKGVFYPGNSSNPRLGGYELNLIHPVSGKICKSL